MTAGGLAASRKLIVGQLSALPQLLKLGAPVLEPDLHLCLGQAQRCCQLGSLGQCQVLGFLEPPLQGSQLEAGVDGSGFADFLGLPVDYPDLGLALLLLWFVVCRGRTCSVGSIGGVGAVIGQVVGLGRVGDPVDGGGMEGIGSQLSIG